MNYRKLVIVDEEDTQLDVFVNTKNKLLIGLNFDECGGGSFVLLDKADAIELVKELKELISEMR
jgi:hypothetical protein